MKVYSHEGDGENTEHLNSMDLHDIKTELERDAEKAEVSVCEEASEHNCKHPLTLIHCLRLLSL